MTFKYRVCRVPRTLARHYADHITQPTVPQSMFLQIQFSHLSHSANTATNHQILNLLHPQYIQYSVFLASWQRILFSFASSIQFKISSQSSEGQYRIISSPHRTASDLPAPVNTLSIFINCYLTYVHLSLLLFFCCIIAIIGGMIWCLFTGR